MSIIEDGTGKGFSARVNNQNQLLTLSESFEISDISILRGNGFVLNTGIKTLTSDSESAITYLKNNDSKIMVISSATLLTGVAAGAAAGAEATVALFTSITSGTIVSDAINVQFIRNLNVGSGNIINADVFSGGEGKTVSGTALSNQITIPPASTGPGITTAVPQGETLSTTVTPPTGNTSMSYQLIAVVYFIDGIIDLNP